MSSASCKRLRTDQRFCPHCNKLLSYKTFRAHKRLYYDEPREEWCRVSVDQVQAEHADDEIPPSAQEFEHFSMETEPSLCSNNDDEVPSPSGLGECEQESPPHTEAGFSEQSEVGRAVCVSP